MSSDKINRRNFIRKSSLTALGAGVAAKITLGNNDEPKKANNAKIMEYRKFGRTGFDVSDISSGSPSNEAVLKALIKKGVNLIDTGEVYGNGNSERLIGRVIQDFDRSKLFINTKLYTEKSFPSKEDVIERTNKCLERLQTDYVDCMQIHSAENSDILKDEAFHAGMEQLKKEGKVRHVGVSCHGNNWAYNTEENLEKILMAAVDDGRFDVILLAYNFVNAEIAEKVLEACDKKNIGTIIMKSNPVHIYGLMEDRVKKLEDEGKEVDEYTKAFYDKYKIMHQQATEYFSEYLMSGEDDLSAAASKYVLSNKQAHTTIWDFRNFTDVQSMLSLSGQKLTNKDDLVLRKYKEHFGHLSCKIGCNACHAACPKDIPVNKILRYNYYFSVKQQEKKAMTKFARLNSLKPSEACASCEGHCEKACPYGVETRPLLAAAQQNMDFIV